MRKELNPVSNWPIAHPENYMDFKPIEIIDRSIFMEYLHADPQETSETTFTNLFMWRKRYEPMWAVSGDLLCIIMRTDDGDYFGLPPIGLGDKQKGLFHLFNKLRQLSPEPRIARAAKSFVKTDVDRDLYDVVLDRDNSDYVYLVDELTKLRGNRFHKKKNHINSFKKKYQFEYKDLKGEIIEAALALQEDWCEFRNCAESDDLTEEDKAIYQALCNFEFLELKGGAILVNGMVEAFTFGELLNPETVVIHVEKANPRIRGLYPLINQLFLVNAWPNIKFVNREQDLGVEGLRKAKESYFPHHMVEKFNIYEKNDSKMQND